MQKNLKNMEGNPKSSIRRDYKGEKKERWTKGPFVGKYRESAIKGSTKGEKGLGKRDVP